MNTITTTIDEGVWPQSEGLTAAELARYLTAVTWGNPDGPITVLSMGDDDAHDYYTRQQVRLCREWAQRQGLAPIAVPDAPLTLWDYGGERGRVHRRGRPARISPERQAEWAEVMRGRRAHEIDAWLRQITETGDPGTQRYRDLGGKPWSILRHIEWIDSAEMDEDRRHDERRMLHAMMLAAYRAAAAVRGSQDAAMWIRTRGRMGDVILAGMLDSAWADALALGVERVRWRGGKSAEGAAAHIDRTRRRATRRMDYIKE